MCGRVCLSSHVSEIKLFFIAPRRLGAPDDLCRADDAEDLDKISHLVEQVRVSIVFAPSAMMTMAIKPGAISSIQRAYSKMPSVVAIGRRTRQNSVNAAS